MTHRCSSHLLIQIRDANDSYDETGGLTALRQIFPLLAPSKQAPFAIDLAKPEFQEALQQAAEACNDQRSLPVLLKLLPLLSVDSLARIAGGCAFLQWRDGYWAVRRSLPQHHGIKLTLWEAFWMFDPAAVHIADAEEANASLTYTVEIVAKQRYPVSDLERFLELCVYRFPPLNEYWFFDDSQSVTQRTVG
jgi:hypothetical protein